MFVERLGSPNPRLIFDPVSPNSIYAVALDSIYRIELGRLLDFDRSMDFKALQEGVVTVETLATSCRNSLPTVEECGFYSVLVIENLLLVLRGYPDCLLEAHYINC